VEHNADGCLEIRWETCDNVLERPDSPGGSADHNQVAAGLAFGVGGWFAHT
jgi:hypothetical protein